MILLLTVEYMYINAGPLTIFVVVLNVISATWTVMRGSWIKCCCCWTLCESALIVATYWKLMIYKHMVIRLFFPKKTNFNKIHQSTIKSVENKINNRPVRKFKYLTPNQIALQLKIWVALICWTQLDRVTEKFQKHLAFSNRIIKSKRAQK